MKLIAKLLLTVSVIYCAIAEAAPMNDVQLQRQLNLVAQQFMVLDKTIEAGDKKATCREGFKALDLYYEIDPRIDLPQEALSAYANTAASMNKLISALKTIGCVPPNASRKKYNF